MKSLIILLAIVFNLQIANAGGSECEPIIKTVYKTKVEVVYIEVPVEVYVPIEIEIQKDVTKKNRVSLLVLNGPSDNVRTATTSTATTVRHESKDALGVQFSRDLGSRFHLLIQGDTNSNVAVGVGLGF